MYSVGAWILVSFLVGFALVDIYDYITLSCQFSLFTIKFTEYIKLWSMYEDSDKKYVKDSFYSSILVAVIGFIVASVISEENVGGIIFLL